jgi:PAS domain-containing protein
MGLKTVDVPKEFEPIFARAEEVVGSYFAGCSHDPSQAAIEIGGERYILVRAASLSIEFFSLVRRLFGAGRESDADEFAGNILYDLAHAIGKSDADNFHSKMHLEDPLARLSAGPVHFSHSGWAFVKIFSESHPTPDRDYCLIYDHPQSFEAEAWLSGGQKSDLPVCVMNAGYSSGWCESSFGIPLVAVEILCRAKGDSCCRFIMAPPETIAEQVERFFECRPDHLSRKELANVPEFFARKRLEDKLRRSEQEFRDLAERSFDIIFTVDAEGRFTYVSPASEKVLGYSPEEATGKHFTELLAESATDRAPYDARGFF